MRRACGKTYNIINTSKIKLYIRFRRNPLIILFEKDFMDVKEEDTWLGNLPLAEQYPSLYNIEWQTNVLVNVLD